MLKAFESILGNSIYAPLLLWKKGERDALRSLPHGFAKRVIPLFTMPPAGEFDHDTGTILSLAEHIRHFGPRLHESRGQLPVFIDAAWLDQRTAADTTQHPLASLLERARLAGAQAWPATSLDRSPAYQAAISKARKVHGLPVALRLRFDELDLIDCANSSIRTVSTDRLPSLRVCSLHRRRVSSHRQSIGVCGSDDRKDQ